MIFHAFCSVQYIIFSSVLQLLYSTTISRTQADLNNNNFDSVIGKSRTLVEEVLIYILEQKQDPYVHKGNFNGLFNKVKKCLNIQQNEEFDEQIESILSGLDTTIKAVLKLRNTQSDSHGAGTKRINIRRREAQLVVNSAITFAEYIFSVYSDQVKNSAQ